MFTNSALYLKQRLSTDCMHWHLVLHLHVHSNLVQAGFADVMFLKGDGGKRTERRIDNNKNMECPEWVKQCNPLSNILMAILCLCHQRVLFACLVTFLYVYTVFVYLPAVVVDALRFMLLHLLPVCDLCVPGGRGAWEGGRHACHHAQHGPDYDADEEVPGSPQPRPKDLISLQLSSSLLPGSDGGPCDGEHSHCQAQEEEERPADLLDLECFHVVTGHILSRLTFRGCLLVVSFRPYVRSY